MNTSTTASGRGRVVAGLFHGPDKGDRALADLKAAGFTRVEISQADADSDARNLPPSSASADDDDRTRGSQSATAAGAAGAARAAASPFFHEHDSSASSFVDELIRLGFSKHDAHDLVDGLVKGDALVTADAGPQLDRAVSILNRHGADIRYSAGGDGAVVAGAAGAVAVDARRTAQGVGATVPDAMSEADREIQLRAERLVVNKQRVQHGEARIRKEVVTETKSIDVPVSHEELVIERHAVTGDGTVDSEPIADATIRIPLTEEKVTVNKQTVVKEEVEVGTRRIEDVEHVSDTVRHEELRVDDRTTPPDQRTR